MATIEAHTNESTLRAKMLEDRFTILVVVFLASLFVPLIFSLGFLRLSVYRIVMLLMFAPALFLFVSGKAGKWRTSDSLMILMVAWIALSWIFHFGIGESIEAIGIITLEHLGAYLIGRTFIRTPSDFRKMAVAITAFFLLMLPGGLIEALTAKNVILDFWNSLGRTPPDVYKEPRLGLDRVQGPFDHPILFGLFATPVMGLACFVVAFGRGTISATMLTAVVFLTGFLSVSSGPISALAVQVGLILWETVLKPIKQRWWILFGLAVTAYIAISLLSTRSPIVVAISYLALNAQTGIARVYIWEWGWVNIAKNPIFGIGRGNDWERYAFMTASFDMFWLLYAMSYGLLAGIGQFFSAHILMWQVARRKFTDKRIDSYRMGWIVGMAGLAFAGWMVHLWNAPLVMIFFLLGSGVWFLDYSEDAASGESEAKTDGPRQDRRFTRFEKGSEAPKTDRKQDPVPRQTPPAPRNGPSFRRDPESLK